MQRDLKFLSSFVDRWGTEVAISASQGGLISTFVTLDSDSSYKDKGEIPDIALLKQAQKYVETSANTAHHYHLLTRNDDLNQVRKETFNDGINLIKGKDFAIPTLYGTLKCTDVSLD